MNIFRNCKKRFFAEKRKKGKNPEEFFSISALKRLLRWFESTKPLRWITENVIQKFARKTAKTPAEQGFSGVDLLRPQHLAVTYLKDPLCFCRKTSAQLTFLLYFQKTISVIIPRKMKAFKRLNPWGRRQAYKMGVFFFCVGAVFLEQEGQLVYDLVEETDDFLKETLMNFAALEGAVTAVA